MTTPVPPLRAARLAKNLSLRAVAQLADVDPGHLSKVERGESQLSVESLYRLAVVLEFDDLVEQLAPCINTDASTEVWGIPSDALADADGPLRLARAAAENRATAPISAEVIARLRALRRIRKVSAQVLAERMTAAGYPIKRSVIANLESGRRAEVSVDHLVAAAEALGTTAEAILSGPMPTCPTCKGEPPTGFTCNTCGANGAEGGEDRA
ncbi:helix-turn-helix transcriptional regulator [Streptomyces chartreusis]|uniref:helix-turn-helix transcriptional regulator n=1 Tax=Streptomyces chartreusis TaxID=1969 RepID=UPI00382DE533